MQLLAPAAAEPSGSGQGHPRHSSAVIALLTLVPFAVAAAGMVVVARMAARANERHYHAGKCSSCCQQLLTWQARPPLARPFGAGSGWAVCVGRLRACSHVWVCVAFALPAPPDIRSLWASRGVLLLRRWRLDSCFQQCSSQQRRRHIMCPLSTPYTALGDSLLHCLLLHCLCCTCCCSHHGVTFSW